MADRHWNYRLIRRVTTEEFLAVHEVFYKDGVPWMCSAEPVALYGHTEEDIQQTMLYITKGMTLPVLNWDDFEPFDAAKAALEVAAAKEGN